MPGVGDGGRALWLLLGLLALVLGITATAGAQQQGGVVTGLIVDSETLRPLDRAGVELDPVALVGGANGSGGPGRYAVFTDSLGKYRFSDVRPGVYRLVVRRVGYATRAVEVDLREAGSALLSLGLQVEPVQLPPVRVLGEATQPYSHTDGSASDRPEVQAEVARRRQLQYLAGDVRELTHADVVEAVTLAESDIFRALQRTPGVTTRDDYTATLWTRGASWDQTRVYFDGLPLYNPTHAGWLFSAINPDAVGKVAFYPGMRSAQWGEGAAGVLEVRSRSGGEGGARLRGRGEVSVASARMALDGQLLDGKLGWMVAGRRTYVDVLRSMTTMLTGHENANFPYDFADLVTRVDGRLGRGWGFSASGIVERDNLRGDVPGLLRNNSGSWGNQSGQASVTVPAGPIQATVQTGRTRFHAAIERHRKVESKLQRDPTLPPLEATIHHRGLNVEFRPRARGSALPKWGVGMQLVRDSVGYEGPYPLVNQLAVVLPVDTASQTQQLGIGLEHHVFWAERRLDLGTRLAVEGGVRVETGDSVQNGGSMRIAPRVAGRWVTPGGMMLSSTWSRSYQYTQDIAPVAGPLGPQLHLTHLWVLATGRKGGYPAIRADVSTLGLEHWVGRGWLASANAYHRRASGVEVPYPDSGRVTPDRVPNVAATNRAQGLELSARKLAGRWTGSLGYAFGVSRLTAEVVRVRDTVSVSFPSPADVRHAVDATGLAWVGRGVRVGGSFTFGSGVPFTRLILPGLEQGDLTVYVGPANGHRTPSYSSLDLMVDYTTTAGVWQLTGYLQVRNVLGNANRVTYSGSRWCSGSAPQIAAARVVARPEQCGSDPVYDQFERGLPRLPLVGIRASF